MLHPCNLFILYLAACASVPFTYFFPSPYPSEASLVAQLVKNLPAMWETWVQSLEWKDPLQKGKAAHYSILA